MSFQLNRWFKRAKRSPAKRRRSRIARFESLEPRAMMAVDLAGFVSDVSFDNPVVESEPVVEGVGTSSFQWGQPARSSASRLSFEGGSFSVTPNEVFSLGTLQFTNGSIYLGTGATGIDLSMELSFPGQEASPVTLQLGIDNTLNNDSGIDDGDWISIAGGATAVLAGPGGRQVSVEILGFGKGTEATPESSIMVAEHQADSFNLLARIVADDSADVDLIADSLTWNDEGGVDIQYLIAGDLASTDAVAAVYWATGETSEDRIGEALFEQTVISSDDGYGPIRIPAEALADRPDEATHLVLVLDSQNAVEESDEDNNTAAVVVPTVDLEATAAHWPLPHEGGGAIVEYKVSGGVGLRPFPDSTISVYWSSDGSLDHSSQKPVYEYQLDNVANGHHELHIPHKSIGAPPDGAKYLIIEFDSSNAVDEIEEDNNVHSLEVVPLVINVVTHGFNPDMENFNELRTALDTVPAKGSMLDNRIETIVPEWNSDDGFLTPLYATALSTALKLVPGASQTPVGIIAGLVADLALKDWSEYGRAVSYRNAQVAAAGIDQYLRTQLLVDAEANPRQKQVIHLIGHSRGAAVNAHASKLLAEDRDKDGEADYIVDQFTSLDGYSTDWPDGGGFFADFSINAETRAHEKINYRVEAPLPVAWFDPPGARDNIPINNAIIDAVHRLSPDWRAPNREIFGFDDITIPAKGQELSHHLNIVELYTGAQRYLHDNYAGQQRNRK